MISLFRDTGIHRAEMTGIWVPNTFAHFSKDVLNDDELMRLAAWKSRQMLGRFARSDLTIQCQLYEDLPTVPERT